MAILQMVRQARKEKKNENVQRNPAFILFWSCTETSWPQGLLELDLGDDFNHPLEGVTLPAGLERLYLSVRLLSSYTACLLAAMA